MSKYATKSDLSKMAKKMKKADVEEDKAMHEKLDSKQMRELKKKAANKPVNMNARRTLRGIRK